MSDDQLSRSGEKRPASLDVSMLPLGERAWRAILDHVVAVGDEAETTYLEVKSNVDLARTAGVAKVAKFLLGAANRRPKTAAAHLGGYAVMIIGAEKGAVPGMPRGVEAHELEDRLRPYLGPQFPGFEFGRLGIDDEREVLFVIALPPLDGQSIFPCHKNFQGEERRDNLADGAIYVRGASNSRPARAGEVLGLVERARGGGELPMDLEVQVMGTISRVLFDIEVLERLYELEEEDFNKPPRAIKGSELLRPGLLGDPRRPLSIEERAERRAAVLEAWRSEKAANIAKGRGRFLGAVLPGVGVRVVSRDRAVSKPELIVTFHDCEAFKKRDVDDINWEQIVEPVGRSRSPFGPTFDPDEFDFTPANYPVDWENDGGDVVVTLTPQSLRPNTPWVSGDEDYVIVARDPGAKYVSVRWTLTEEGNHEVIQAGLQIPAGDVLDAWVLFKDAYVEEK